MQKKDIMDEEIRLLNAISLVSERLAKKLALLSVLQSDEQHTGTNIEREVHNDTLRNRCRNPHLY